MVFGFLPLHSPPNSCSYILLPGIFMCQCRKLCAIFLVVGFVTKVTVEDGNGGGLLRPVYTKEIRNFTISWAIMVNGKAQITQLMHRTQGHDVSIWPKDLKWSTPAYFQDRNAAYLLKTMTHLSFASGFVHSHDMLQHRTKNVRWSMDWKQWQSGFFHVSEHYFKRYMHWCSWNKFSSVISAFDVEGPFTLYNQWWSIRTKAM